MTDIEFKQGEIMYVELKRNLFIKTRFSKKEFDEELKDFRYYFSDPRDGKIKWDTTVMNLQMFNEYSYNTQDSVKRNKIDLIW